MILSLWALFLFQTALLCVPPSFHRVVDPVDEYKLTVSEDSLRLPAKHLHSQIWEFLRKSHFSDQWKNHPAYNLPSNATDRLSAILFPLLHSSTMNYANPLPFILISGSFGFGGACSTESFTACSYFRLLSAIFKPPEFNITWENFSVGACGIKCGLPRLDLYYLKHQISTTTPRPHLVFCDVCPNEAIYNPEMNVDFFKLLYNVRNYGGEVIFLVAPFFKTGYDPLEMFQTCLPTISAIATPAGAPILSYLDPFLQINTDPTLATSLATASFDADFYNNIKDAFHTDDTHPSLLGHMLVAQLLDRWLTYQFCRIRLLLQPPTLFQSDLQSKSTNVSLSQVIVWGLEKEEDFIPYLKLSVKWSWEIQEKGRVGWVSREPDAQLVFDFQLPVVGYLSISYLHSYENVGGFFLLLELLIDDQPSQLVTSRYISCFSSHDALSYMTFLSLRIATPGVHRLTFVNIDVLNTTLEFFDDRKTHRIPNEISPYQVRIASIAYYRAPGIPHQSTVV